MRNLFRSKHRVTQAFNVNPDYYKKFGLKAHEGLDIVPTGSVWDVLCLADGVVVKDEDNALSGAYGRNVTVWHPKLNKATQYCHFKENYVVNGQVVSMGEKLGLMGSTGNTSGAHVHLNLFDTDENGIRLNKNNGYLGGIDPLPFIEEEIVTIPSNTSELEKCSTARNSHWDDLQTIKSDLSIVGEYSLELIRKRIETLLIVERDYGTKEQQLSAATTKATDLESQVEQLRKDNITLIDKASVLTSKVSEYEKTVNDSTNKISDLLKQVQDLKQGITKPSSTGVAKIWEGIVELFGRR